MPHLHWAHPLATWPRRDWAHPSYIGTETGLTLVQRTSEPPVRAKKVALRSEPKARPALSALPEGQAARVAQAPANANWQVGARVASADAAPAEAAAKLELEREVVASASVRLEGSKVALPTEAETQLASAVEALKAAAAAVEQQCSQSRILV